MWRKASKNLRLASWIVSKTLYFGECREKQARISIWGGILASKTSVLESIEKKNWKSPRFLEKGGEKQAENHIISKKPENHAHKPNKTEKNKKKSA